MARSRKGGKGPWGFDHDQGEPVDRTGYSFTMKRFRRRPIRARIAIFAVLALLWSQVVLAGHPACSMGFMALAELGTVAQPAGEGAHGCHDQAIPADEAVCTSHCGQSSLSSDVARVPDVPALPAAIPVAVITFAFLPSHSRRHIGLPPPVSWHRPTAHPAALLLI